MNILFIHQGYPGQFKHLIPELRARGDKICLIKPEENKAKNLNSDLCFSYKLLRGNGTDTHHLALETESKVLRGEAVASIAFSLKKAFYNPDLIVAHPGWGEALFLKDIWPDVPQLHYVEFVYGAKGTDLDFKDRLEGTLGWEEKARGRMKNANVFLNLASMDWGITPTYFQHSTLPSWAQIKTSVIHDGINTSWASPNKNSYLRLKDGTLLTASSEVITFVNRTFEPYRGIHVFIKALPKLLKMRPNAQIVLVGQDTPKVSYGAHRHDNQGWLSSLQSELIDAVDWSRVHAVGKVPHNTLREIFRISSVHVYLTYPFVLSWSLLEAMSCGALIVGSDTAPVNEVIVHKENGLLVPFKDSNKLSDLLLEILVQPGQFEYLRHAARETVKRRYDLDNCLKQQISLIDALAKGAIAA